MNTNAELYTQDLYAWTQEQAARLREGAWHELDLEHLSVSRRVRPRSRSTSAEARGLHGGFLRQKHELSGRVCRQWPTTAFVGDNWGRSKKVSEGLTMSTNAALYDQDFYTWCLTTAALIRAGKWYDLDPASVAEEIESLGKSDRRALGACRRELFDHRLRRIVNLAYEQKIQNRRLRSNTQFYRHVARMLTA